MATSSPSPSILTPSDNIPPPPDSAGPAKRPRAWRAPRHSNGPKRAAVQAIAGSKQHLTARLEQRIRDMSVKDSWVVADAAAALPPARRRLPTSKSGGALATAALAVVLSAVAQRWPQAEALALYFPRIFLGKGGAIEEGIERFVAGALPPNRTATPRSPIERWTLRVKDALRERSNKRLVQLLQVGPVAPSTETRENPQQFFPDVIQQGDEATRWQQLAMEHGMAEDDDIVTAASLRSWARRHAASAAGRTGWASSLILDFDKYDPHITGELANLWGRKPTAWLDPRAATHALRRCDGWLIPRPGRTARPIAAPQVMRRVQTAAASRKCIGAVAAYCEPKGQYGCSGSEKLLAYSVLPALLVQAGGTTVSADRSMSFQTLNRTSLLDAMTQFGTFAESAGVQTEAAALFAAADAVVFDSAHRLPRSVVDFRDEACEVKALAQGCSTSPLLEAITLATALGQHSTPRGAVIHGAHDDLQLSWQHGTDLSRIQLPDTSAIGGVYNVAKAIVVGADAHAAVAAGLAAKAAPYTTVWGRPVGDLAGWLKEHWLPKWQKRVTGLRTLITVDADLAAESMYRLRGPGAAARHWLRGTPPALLTDTIMDLLRDCDKQWVDLWVVLAGHDPANIETPLRQRLHGCVYGTLAQEAAASIAAYESAVGMRSIFVELIDTARRSGIDPRPWGRALGLEPLLNAPSLTPSTYVVGECTRLLNERVAALTPKRNAREGTNLWVAAFGDPGTLRGRVDAALAHRTHGTLAFAAAKVLGLPIWPLLAGDPTASGPPACGLCKAANLHDSRRYGVAGLNPSMAEPPEEARKLPPRMYLDNHGEHIAVCEHLPLPASFKRRHDALVRLAVGIARDCGIDATVHDAPLCNSSNLRPADWYERDADSRDFPRGICVDLTIVSGGPDRLATGVAHKMSKYNDLIKLTPGLGLHVAGISTAGLCSPGTTATLARWATRKAYHGARLGEERDNAGQAVTTAFARGFAALMAAQAHHYWRELVDREKGMGRSARTPFKGFHPSTRLCDIDTFLRDTALFSSAFMASGTSRMGETSQTPPSNLPRSPIRRTGDRLPATSDRSFFVEG